MSYFHPDRMPALPARRRAAARRQLEELVARSARSGRRARRPGRQRRDTAVIPVVAVLMVLIAIGTGAAAVIMSGPVTDHSSMRCYSAPRRSLAYYTTVAQPAHALTAAAITHAKGICTALFREGFLKSGTRVVPAKRPLFGHRVPPLVVCVGEDGAAAVVPGRDAAETCGKIGLKAAARQ